MNRHYWFAIFSFGFAVLGLVSYDPEATGWKYALSLSSVYGNLAAFVLNLATATYLKK